MKLNTINNSVQRSQCLCAFLILNYETYWESISCVKSIFATIGKEKVDSGICPIIIVDNGSKNDSLPKLKLEYKKEEYIYIVSSRTNLGFAQGNNIGFKFIKDNFDANFICMINSDILMTDNDFLDKLIADYESTNFDVAGPNVVSPNSSCLNPQHSILLDINAADKLIRELSFRLKLCDLHLEPIYAALVRVKNIIAKKDYNTFGEGTTRQLDYKIGDQIHGCFIIFSERYIQKFDGLYNETFLYCEEALLRLRCQRAEMEMWYLSDISALHNESRTEKFIGGCINERHRKRFNNTLNSVKIVKKYISYSDKL